MCGGGVLLSVDYSVSSKCSSYSLYSPPSIGTRDKTAGDAASIISPMLVPLWLPLSNLWRESLWRNSRSNLSLFRPFLANREDGWRRDLAAAPTTIYRLRGKTFPDLGSLVTRYKLEAGKGKKKCFFFFVCCVSNSRMSCAVLKERTLLL